MQPWKAPESEPASAVINLNDWEKILQADDYEQRVDRIWRND